MCDGLERQSQTIGWKFLGVLNAILVLVGLCYLTVYFPWRSKPQWIGVLFYCVVCAVLLTWAIVSIGAYRGNILCSTLSRVLSVLFVVIFVAMIIISVNDFIGYLQRAKNEPLYDPFGSNVWAVEAGKAKREMRHCIVLLGPLIIYLALVFAKMPRKQRAEQKKPTSETQD